MNNHRRPLWLYPLFQITFTILGACLVAALLFGLLGFGRPPVAVAIALDLSSSTYGAGIFNAAGTIMAQEVQAVEAYLEKNSPDILRQPNQVQVFGFGGVVKPLTNGFNSDSQQVKAELTQALRNPNLPEQIVASTTNLDLAIEEGTHALRNIQGRCRELLLVTDGEAPVNPGIIADAALSRVKINSVVIGGEAPALATAALATGGVYLSEDVDNLELLFTNRFLSRFNSNIRWIIFWLGCAWIAWMWMLIMPIDRWILQGIMQKHWTISGKLALGNALFWTFATPGIIWPLAGGIPFRSQC
ncbi:MAG: VWA domain-containing protein [Hormoscilla sp. SP5CHS1]|nr:VWA domain-containing protein [Hormoscilla sp. SP5CHS1]